ncbi:hypothetical protein [Micromonospora rhizosphaerae]|uniref:hypothetical protein n=1 Tax=Micromonospora rhizosphaerae TaxID=568872 RepID=UPI00159F07DE|nr:hypothetical protein [Micromonospora rhizosphaerae]
MRRGLGLLEFFVFFVPPLGFVLVAVVAMWTSWRAAGCRRCGFADWLRRERVIGPEG